MQKMPSEAEPQAQLQELLGLIAANTDRTEFLPPRSEELPRNPLDEPESSDA